MVEFRASCARGYVSGWGFSGARVDTRCEAGDISGSDRIGRGGIYVVTRDAEGFSSCV
jgi:hypothetical protein